MVIAALAALNLGFFQNRTSSIGCSTRRSHAKNVTSSSPPAKKNARIRGAVQPVGRALDDGVEDRAEPGDRQGGADEVEPGRVGVLRVRDEEDAEQHPDHDDGHVHEEDRAPVEALEERAAGERAERDADPRGRGPDPDRLRPLRAGEDVRDDRQGRRHDQRAADAHERAACAISWFADPASADRTEPVPKMRRPDLQRRAAAELVAEAAHREQQPGEHERVGVDHPLQLAVRGRQLADDAGERHVEDRVVEDDHQQAEAQHPEDQPPSLGGPALCPLGSAACHGHPQESAESGGADGARFRNARVPICPTVLTGSPPPNMTCVTSGGRVSPPRR